MIIWGQHHLIMRNLGEDNWYRHHRGGGGEDNWRSERRKGGKGMEGNDKETYRSGTKRLWEKCIVNIMTAG